MRSHEFLHNACIEVIYVRRNMMGTNATRIAKATAGKIPWIIPIAVDGKLFKGSRNGSTLLSAWMLETPCTKVTRDKQMKREQRKQLCRLNEFVNFTRNSPKDDNSCSDRQANATTDKAFVRVDIHVFPNDICGSNLHVSWCHLQLLRMKDALRSHVSSYLLIELDKCRAVLVKVFGVSLLLTDLLIELLDFVAIVGNGVNFTANERDTDRQW